jgi:hypothetical protein
MERAFARKSFQRESSPATLRRPGSDQLRRIEDVLIRDEAQEAHDNDLRRGTTT